MKIALVFDIVKGHDEGSDYVALRALFTCRLFNLLFANTEVSSPSISLLNCLQTTPMEEETYFSLVSSVYLWIEKLKDGLNAQSI